MAKKYPDFPPPKLLGTDLVKRHPNDEVAIPQETWKVIFEGEEHEVKVMYKGAGQYGFYLDDSHENTSQGHPVTQDQAPDCPPAVIILIIRGQKGNIAWYTHWEKLSAYAL